MNLILLDKFELTEKSRILLSGRRAEHIIDVLQAKPEKTIKVGLINGNMGSGKVVSIAANNVELEVNDLNTAPPSPLPVILIVAMQRPKTMRKILQSATAMGVKKFFIIETWKVEKSYWTSPLLLTENLEEQFLLGLEQGGDTIMPEIEIRKRFKPFVEDELKEIIGDSIGLIAHPDSETECPHQVNQALTLAIGPEGGFTDYEVEKMTEAGMLPITLGPRTLRSEFAVTTFLSKLF